MPPAEREKKVERLLADEPRRPYDLEKEPAFRVTLIRLGATEHVLIVMMHHILCDWASIGNIWRDLSACYDAGCRSEQAVLPALPIQHGDYAIRQNELASRGAFAKDLEYWRERLHGAPALLELPADRPRPPVCSFKGSRIRFEISPDLTRTLRARAQEERVSLFTVFAAALDALLYRYSGQEDIVIGLPISGRDESEVQNLIGFFLHTHALRTQLSGQWSFRDLLLRVQRDILDLYLHRAPPFDEVVGAHGPARSSSYSPIFQVMLNWRGGDNLLSNIGLNGLTAESVLVDSKISKFDLTLMLTDAGDTIDLEIEYSTDLFDAARIERMAGHLSVLLEGVAADPTRPLFELPLLTEAERHQYADWNRTERPYPTDRCVHSLIEEQVKFAPNATAVTFQGERLTYRALDERANRVAKRLRALGVGRDTLVAVCMDRSLDMGPALLGVWKAGAAYVPLDPAYPRERLVYMLSDSRALLILTEERLRAQFEGPDIQAKCLCIEDDQEAIPDEAHNVSTPPPDPEDAAYVIYTSGSTGAPKGVEIRHRNMVNLLHAMETALKFGANDKLLAVTTISFDIAGLELFLPLISGAQVEIAATSELRDGFALRKRVEQSGATLIQATPATWNLLIETGWAGDPNLRILCGGEAMTSALAEALVRRVGDVWNVYGPTETTIWSSFERIGSGKPISIGRPIANTQFHVADKHGELTPIGVPGELLIGGDGLARGYFHRPELTAEKFIPDRFSSRPADRLYRTGDLVRRLPDGDIEWLARLDHQVKIRGFRIELGEIEAILATHPAVREVVAAAREDRPGDKRLVAYLTTKSEPPKETELRALLRAKMPEHMIPSVFVSLDKFPLTANGKIDRKALPRPDLHSANRTEAAKRLTVTQKAMSDIWRRALGVEQVGLRDNFFDLGGHSLLAIRVIAEINRMLGLHIDVPSFFQDPTIEALAGSAAVIRHAPITPKVARLQAGQDGPPLYFIGASPVESQIAKFIGGERAIFGTVVPLPVKWRRALSSGNRKECPTMEQLGSLHAHAIGAHAGETPCVLAGYSFHGKVVVEAAREFQRRGGRVTAILLIDSNAWGGDVRKVGDTLKRIWGINGDTAFSERRQEANVQGRLRHSLALAAWTAAQAPSAVRRRFSRIAFGAEVEEENGWFDEEGAPVKLTEMMQLFLSEDSSFDPSPIDARAVLFRTRRPGDGILSAERLDNGWGGCFTQGLQIVEVNGDHWTLVRDEQNAASLARRINAVLAGLSTAAEPVREFA
jgi:amino acid adenylation domain-containing protein